MAKKNAMGEVVMWGALVVGSYVGYTKARTGDFGPTMQKLATDIHNAFGGLTLTNVPPGGAPPPAGTPPPSGSCGALAGPFPQDLANPNFTEQMNAWRTQRAARGENCHDWAALRAHELAIGAPDPGPTPVAGF